MSLAHKLTITDEPMLEKWARLFRFEASRNCLSYLLKTRNKVRIIDIGCGQDTHFFTYLQHTFPNDWHRIEYIGFDPLINPKQKKTGLPVTILTNSFESVMAGKAKLPQADLVTMFAVLEHVDREDDLLALATSLLKPNGVIFATTPTHLAKVILEVLAFGFGIISPREIAEHKRYFHHVQLADLVKKISRRSKQAWTMKHRYFELGLNNAIFIHR